VRRFVDASDTRRGKDTIVVYLPDDISVHCIIPPSKGELGIGIVSQSDPVLLKANRHTKPPPVKGNSTAILRWNGIEGYVS
jgi:hypothetical protein